MAWAEDNSRYLSGALRWLHTLLEDRTTSQESDQVSGHTPSSWHSSSRHPVEESTQADELAALQSQMQPPPALVFLAERLGLSAFERNLLLLCVAAEFDTSMTSAYAHAQRDPNRTYPTFALALSIFADPSWDALSPERPLRYWRLIEITQPGQQALTTSPLRADERIVNFVKGLNYLDDRLTPYLSPILSFHGIRLPASQHETVQTILSLWQQTTTLPSLPVIQLVGADAESKYLVASQAAAGIGRRLYRIPVEALPGQPADLELLARLWQRESALLPIALYIDARDCDDAVASANSANVRRFLSRSDGVFMVAVREAWPSLARESWIFDVSKPTAEEQRKEWTEALGATGGDTARLLASHFNLNLSDIHQVATTAAARAASNSHKTSDRVWDMCRARVRPLLDTLAHRLDLKAGWDDIVLPEEELALLRQIANQVKQRTTVYEQWGFARRMNRGLGINALFSGESGTGKTMAAEVIANDLRLNLYRIDLSAIVSKYIGETEKNLRRLFEAAEEGGVILLFDEADALFGKRSEVKDSHDRYANIEVNYLLQRMEAYTGLAILATNMRSALDIAFTRRLRFIVNFPFPTVADRREMWKRVFPAETPLERLDYDRLARVNLTGGSIHNAAINAAFLAAQAGTKINMLWVLTAIRNELIKMDRPFNEAEFRDHGKAGAVA